MKQSKTSKFAYLAGIIDGEGTIGIYKKSDSDKNFPGNGRGLSSYKLTIAVGQKNGPVIDWLYGNFGGKIFTKQQVTTVPNGKKKYNHHMYEWRLSSIDEIEYILKRMIPFMHEKKRQAEIALDFVQKYKHIKSKGVQNGFVLKFEPEVINNWKTQAALISIKLKNEKRKFVPCAAVETKFSEPSNDGKL